jgi:uncharacterized protein
MGMSQFLLPILALVGAGNLAAAEPFPEFQPKPAIWKMADEDTEIYMIGTIHLLPPELKWRSKELDGVIARVDELVLETVADESADDGLSPVLERAMLQSIDRKPLMDRVDPKNRATLQLLVKQLNLSMDFLDMVPTWMISFIMSDVSADEEGVSRDAGADSVLEAQFKKIKKPVGQIESADAVDMRLNSLSDEEQMIALDEMLTDIRTAPAFSLLPDQPLSEHRFAEQIAWAKGDVSKVSDGLTPEILGPAYYRVLLVDRNKAWTEWLEQRMAKSGKILLAVGAGHLNGPDSVQTMLAKKGRKVERIH